MSQRNLRRSKTHFGIKLFTRVDSNAASLTQCVIEPTKNVTYAFCNVAQDSSGAP